MLRLIAILFLISASEAIVSAANMCQPLKLPGAEGTITFNNPEHLTGFFSALQQTGVAQGQYPFSFSLCDPTLVADGGRPCTPPSFISQGTGTTAGCNVLFPTFVNNTYLPSTQQVQFVYTGTSSKIDWQANVQCSCDYSALSLQVPSGSYAATQNSQGTVIFDFQVSSAACCVSKNRMVIPLNNNTEVVLDDDHALAGWFPAYQQVGLGQNGAYPWAISLLDPTIVPVGSASCGAGSYLAEGTNSVQTCDFIYANKVQAPTFDYTTGAVQFQFQNNGLARSTATVYCYCAQWATTLQTLGSYTAWQIPSGVIETTFNVASSECCARSIPTTTTTTTTVAPAPTPSGTAGSCNPVQTPQGRVSFQNVAQLSAFYPSLQQTGVAVGTYPWQFQLCNPSLIPPNGVACNPPTYLNQGSGGHAGCNLVFPTMQNLAYNDQVGKIQFQYSSTSSELVWQATLTCTCDMTANASLVIPSNSYDAIQSPSGVILLDYSINSAACCPDAVTETTTSTTPSTTTMNPTVTTISTVPPTTTATEASQGAQIIYLRARINDPSHFNVLTFLYNFVTILGVQVSDYTSKIDPSVPNQLNFTITVANPTLAVAVNYKVDQFSLADLNNLGVTSVVEVSSAPANPPPTASPNNNQNEDNGLGLSKSTTEAVGGALGGVVVLLLIVIIVILVRGRKSDDERYTRSFQEQPLAANHREQAANYGSGAEVTM